jgi:hypothetical protein
VLTPERVAAEMISAIRVQSKPVTDDIGEVLFELVQNTEWHTARRPGGRTGRNVRVITFDRVVMGAQQIAALREEDSSFARYVENCLRVHSQGARNVTLGVASIIDTGVGFARTAALASGATVDESNEISFLIAALGKTVRTSRAQMGDIGIPRVQQLLSNLRGFMLVRSGRIEVRRDFIERPFEPINRTSPRASMSSQFVDWIPSRTEDFMVGERVGSEVTFCLPLDFELAVA